MSRKYLRRNLQSALIACGLALGPACSAEPDSPGANAPDAAPDKAMTAAPAVADSTEPTPYTVECVADPETGGKSCTVDKETFVGWRMYHAFCHVCHAQDAVGSTFAPSLVERMQVIDKARFIDVVANGYTGQIGVMPPWKDNPNISKRYEELYAYLMARADGVLLPGRPKKQK